jgi:glycosyltransferase involved in cell wall biosynthesis
METKKLKALLISIVPPQNDCGVRVVMYRHLMEHDPFNVYVVTNADFYNGTPYGVKLTLPYPIYRLRKTRFGPRLTSWFIDYENLIWPLIIPKLLDKTVKDFKPDVILTLAENSLCFLAAKVAKKYNIPLVGLFFDWFPIMKNHYGHAWTRNFLTWRYRKLYKQCKLAFCTSVGMQKALGEHKNSHVIYPMPGLHNISGNVFPLKSSKFRLVYVGSVENFYGRMLCSLVKTIGGLPDIEIIIIGPNADWPPEILKRARAEGVYLGFRPPEEAAAVIAGADALLVLMSFEKEHRFIMETSFTTKFLDYCTYKKPIILWGPEYCCPVELVRERGGAFIVDKPDTGLILRACKDILLDNNLKIKLINEADNLYQTIFNPERLQAIFVKEINKIALTNIKRNESN